jgi:outer membrane murein-binding lipoprotein Lpp
MLVREVIAAATPEGGRVIYAQGCGRWVRPDALPSDETDLMTGDCLLFSLDRDATPDELQGALAAVVEGSAAVALIRTGGNHFPVGRFIDAIVSADLQVIAAIPVEEDQVETVLVLTRSEQMAPIWPYLSPDIPLPLDQRGLRRLVAEYVVEGAARRSRDLVHQREVEALNAEIAAARDETERMRTRAAAAEEKAARASASLEAVKSSRTYEVGKAFADVRRSPLSGMLALPGRVRRAGGEGKDQ